MTTTYSTPHFLSAGASSHSNVQRATTDQASLPGRPASPRDGSQLPHDGPRWQARWLAGWKNYHLLVCDRCQLLASLAAEL